MKTTTSSGIIGQCVGESRDISAVIIYQFGFLELRQNGEIQRPQRSCLYSQPCGRCATRNQECIYPDKKTYVTVPETYLRKLESAVASSHTSPSLATNYSNARSEYPASSQNPQDPGPESENRVAARAAILDDGSNERFVHDLRQLTIPESPGRLRESSGYTYVALKFDFLEPRMVIKLPPQPLAVQLLNTFEEIFCDYHWFLRRDFRERVALIYSDPDNQLKDRCWLARASLVFALGTTFIHGPQALTGNSPSRPSDVPLPPGSDMFEQAVALLNVSSEEPTTEDIEALNLMAFYCYCLNRRRMAYKYATQSLAVAKLLYLDKVANSSSNTEQQVLLEHKKRLWWTSFCMERMVVAELGISPAHGRSNLGLALPTAENIPESELNQFFDSRVLSLQTEMCEIKCQIIEAVSHLRQVSDLETMLFELWPCLSTLQSWRQHVPSSISFDFMKGVPVEMIYLPCARGLASLYLRYHQCFTVILRPLFSKELSLLLQGADPKQFESGLTMTQRQRIQVLKREGLQAARNNCRILLDLVARGKLAKFGYWDSVHAFSSLSIMSISRAVAPDLSESPQYNDDAYLYSQCRVMLKDMAEAGNPASKDHHLLLADVENIVQNLMESAAEEKSAERPVEVETMTPSLDLGEHLWSDADWVNFLNTYSHTM
ncbi:unnamed protein product [Clonostachys chloroleuca]|uniref:Xylanolytic transcriptional activator regulatory domain-containing protein n=1 Tax=Clonostachys chloroleuca TaxID=1926264 RepID=A0AA35M913_9HYPO|nr:unnamed protein product [Clonostachys chloroleuca]